MTDLVVWTASRSQGIRCRTADSVARLFSDLADGQHGRNGIALV
ncbi:hypothetical protein [Nocardia sp. NPDC057030]